MRIGFSQRAPSRLALFAAWAGLTIIIGFRDEVGGDWWNYLYIFTVIKHGDLAHAVSFAEPGYAFANWIGAQAGWGIWFPNVICAAIFSWGLIRFSREQPNVWLAVSVAVYVIILVGMGYTRQSAALGFVMIAITHYGRGAILRMAAFLVLATLFHTSAIMMAAVLGIASSTRGPLTLVIIFILAAVLGYQFYGNLLVLVSRYSTEVFTASGAAARLLLNVLPAIIFLTWPRRLARTAAELKLWSIVSAMAILSVFLLLFVNSSTIADRLGLYLVPLQMFVWPRVPVAFGRKQRQNFMMIAGILAYSLTINVGWFTIGAWAHAWVPYRNYLWESATSRTPPRWFRSVR